MARSCRILPVAPDDGIGIAPVLLAEERAQPGRQEPGDRERRRPAQDRVAPRLTLTRGGGDAVLRGAAALAVSGLLSPRLGTLFREEDRGDPDPVVSRSREYAT